MVNEFLDTQYNLDSTITAIATPVARAALGILRLSGKEALSIANNIFQGNHSLPDCPSHTVHLGNIIDGDKIIDEVLAAVYKGPNSYTGEDMVEFSLHGSPLILATACELLIKNGATLAQPGEFTLRRFLNGKVDLLQAEAVLNIINSSTKKTLESATKQLEGRLSARINPLGAALEALYMEMTAYLDFPDQELPALPIEKWLHTCTKILPALDALLEGFQQGKALKDGTRIVIVGKPNVGKSTIFNILVKDERVIVSPRPGTTRDVIKVTFNIAGLPVKLYDTAGFRIAKDIIEEEGVKRTSRKIDDADLVLFVLDASQPIDQNDINILKKIATNHIRYIPVLNKSDLGVAPAHKTSDYFTTEPIIISALNHEKVDELEAKIEDKIKDIFSNGEATINSLRHKKLLEEARGAVERSCKLMDTKTLELAAFEVKTAITAISTLVGKELTEDILGKIFANFCIGK